MVIYFKKKFFNEYDILNALYDSLENILVPNYQNSIFDYGEEFNINYKTYLSKPNNKLTLKTTFALQEYHQTLIDEINILYKYSQYKELSKQLSFFFNYFLNKFYYG